MFCCHGYAECVVFIFAHQIQSEYYFGNMSASIDDIALKHFSAKDQETYSYYSHSRTRHDFFHLFLSDNRKQHRAKTAEHIKQIIDPLKNL